MRPVAATPRVRILLLFSLLASRFYLLGLPMSVVIKTVNLTKRYGTLVALSNLNLEISAGDCFGFIGPNGAGKSTTIKILATLPHPPGGGPRVCDYVVGYQSRQIRPLIGFVPDYF